MSIEGSSSNEGLLMDGDVPTEGGVSNEGVVSVGPMSPSWSRQSRPTSRCPWSRPANCPLSHCRPVQGDADGQTWSVGSWDPWISLSC